MTKEIKEILNKISEKEAEYIMELTGAKLIQKILIEFKNIEFLKLVKKDTEYLINKLKNKK